MVNLTVTNNEIRINERECWMCGSKENITEHHMLYKHLNPIKNVIIPLCGACHIKQHSQDISSLGGLAYKIWKSIQDGVKKIPVLKDMISKKQRDMNQITIGDIMKPKGE